MKDKLEAIKAEALAKIESAEVVSSLNDVKVAILGKKGELTQVLKSMKDVAPEDRPKVGQMVNEARQAIETALDEKTKAINRALRAEKMKRETIDVTLPGVKKLTGHRHHLFRQESWRRAIFRSESSHLDEYSELMR